MKTAIIGGGPGGYIAAVRAAQLGAEVTLIEKQYMGGTCLNVGCVPTKALIHAADLYHRIVSEAAKNGIVTGEVSLDFETMQKKKDSVVKHLVGGIGGLMKSYKVTVINGEASFKSPNVIEVKKNDGTGTEEISFDKALIASGSVPSAAPVPGYDLPGVIDSTGALSLEKIPESMCIIGGGVIGIEMAHIYQTLGTKITIVEKLPDILMNLDRDVTAAIRKIMKKNKTVIMTGTKVESIEKAPEGLAVNVTGEDGNPLQITAEKVLMCVGRRPSTDGLGLENAGISTERGRILVDENFRTDNENVYAAGDCIGGIMLAHVASAEGIAAVEHAMGRECGIDFNTVPSCVYTSPELSGAGLTEQEAERQGLDYEVGRFPLIGNGKAYIEGETAGLVKIIAGRRSGRVLGVHMCGPSATELITEGALAIKAGLTTQDLINTIHAHPTVGESVQEAAHAVFGNAMNMPPAK